MISFADGPQLHNLVEAKDYRIICILEVYSQNKNEDDFLENLGLLSQVIREQEAHENLDVEASDGIDRISYSDGGPIENREEPEEPLEDSLTTEIIKAQRGGTITKEVADFCVEVWKADDKKGKKVKAVYKVFKSSNDYEDFTNSLTSLYNKLKR